MVKGRLGGNGMTYGKFCVRFHTELFYRNVKPKLSLKLYAIACEFGFENVTDICIGDIGKDRVSKDDAISFHVKTEDLSTEVFTFSATDFMCSQWYLVLTHTIATQKYTRLQKNFKERINYD